MFDDPFLGRTGSRGGDESVKDVIFIFVVVEK
jgi:hypothetical protein